MEKRIIFDLSLPVGVTVYSKSAIGPEQIAEIRAAILRSVHMDYSQYGDLSFSATALKSECRVVRRAVVRKAKMPRGRGR